MKRYLPLLSLEPLGDDVPPASDVLRGINDLLGDALEPIELDDFFTVDDETDVVLDVPAINEAFLLVTSELTVV